MLQEVMLWSREIVGVRGPSENPQIQRIIWKPSPRPEAKIGGLGNVSTESPREVKMGQEGSRGIKSFQVVSDGQRDNNILLVF